MKKKIIILSIAFIIIFLIIPTIITVCTHNYYFSSRIDYKNNYYEYLTQDNHNFIKTEASFESSNNKLTGFFYSQSENINPEALLIFVHGMGVNHESYLSEINYLTKQNYLVFSYDNTGVNYSEGSGLKGLIQAPLDLQNALNYIYDLDLYNDIPNILIGHSWGGFSVCSVSSLDLKREVDGIISLGGFWRNINVIIDIAEYYVGGVMNLLTPYLSVYEKMLFPKYSYLNGVDGLKNSTCDVLIIHSEDDVIVHYDSNFKYYENEFKSNSRFTFKGYTNYGHALTKESDAYDRIHDIIHHQYDHSEDSEEYKQLNDERNELINQLNYVVLNDITTFINNVIKK